MFTLGLGLTTPYSLGLLVWKFYQTFVIVSIVFWVRFDPQIRPTRFSINFLFITARVERKVRFCVKLFDFFPRSILIRLTWNLSRFVISPYFLQFFSRSILRVKFTTVLLYVVSTLLRRHVKKKSQKWVIGKKTRTYCFRKTGFVHSRSGSDYAQFLGSSCLKIFPDIRHCVYGVLGEIWAPDSSHKIFNKFFIHHYQGWMECSFLCETV